MRRQYRASGGGTVFANKTSPSPNPDSISLIRAYDFDSNPSRPVRPSPLTASTIQGIPLDLLDRLRSFPLFQSAPDSFLTAIGAFLRPQLYQPQDNILTEGDDGKAMYWVVRGAVRVTSRDGESTYAELKPGAFFGEIAVLMDMPRTATIQAKLKSLVVRLNKEDLQKVLPQFPEIERAIRDEAKERLTILERKKKERGPVLAVTSKSSVSTTPKRTTSGVPGDVEMGDVGAVRHGQVLSKSRKRKQEDEGLAATAAGSAFGSGPKTVRQILKELPLFASLPSEVLHFLGLNVQPRTYPPFTDIIRQNSYDRDVYFIVSGEVEVLSEKKGSPDRLPNGGSSPKHRQPQLMARLRAGQYFGEVASLQMAPRRTATVRSVASVECLMISGDVLTELWQKFPPSIRREVEKEARSRLRAVDENDISMSDASDGTDVASELAAQLNSKLAHRPSAPIIVPSVEDAQVNDRPVAAPYDPDPYLNVDLDNIRSRSRRSSLAPPTPEGIQAAEAQNKFGLQAQPHQTIQSSPLKPRPKHVPILSNERISLTKRPKTHSRRPSRFTKTVLPDNILVNIFQHLELHECMKLRQVSRYWSKLLSTSPDLFHELDLTLYNRQVNDSNLASAICPFVGARPRMVNISNCFHITDDGFTVLATTCGANITSWKMKSVWDITGQAVLELVNRSKDLEEIDMSNCRKVGDNLLARVVGWVVPEMAPAQQQQMQAQMQQQQQQGSRGGGRSRLAQRGGPQQAQQQQQQPQIPPGTVIGCSKLKRLTLSYCKHITDRSMAHLAAHAANRLEELDLTRCTTITDQGFQHWSVYPFPRLRKLCLADCTYLSDQAIIALTNAARGLRELDLSFCCALSDTATEVLSLGCPNLTHLNLAFCGSAVSDGSLRCIGLHLLELQELSVRGCVRVTGVGVEAVIDGCDRLEAFDVSQCKNLAPWLAAGGVQRKGRDINFQVVADGSWRVSR